MKTKKEVLRSGDIVKIINPEIFIRCGYPLSLHDMVENLSKKENNNKIISFFKEFDILSINNEEVINYNHLDSNRYLDDYKFRRELAYLILKNKKFGGNERKIYTELKSELKDKEFTIIEKKTIKTGIRISGSGSYEDYDPPYLANEKTHIILKLAEINIFGEEFWIEKKNVIKINKK